MSPAVRKYNLERFSILIIPWNFLSYTAQLKTLIIKVILNIILLRSQVFSLLYMLNVNYLP